MEPVQAYLKKNKRGLGAEKVKKSLQNSENSEHTSSDRKSDKVSSICFSFVLHRSANLEDSLNGIPVYHHGGKIK